MVIVVNKNLINLTPEKILYKEFKIDTRGYRLKEVDQFLDQIIADYQTFNKIIVDLQKEKEEQTEMILKLKQEIRDLKTSVEISKSSSNMLDGNVGIDGRATSFRVKKEFITIFPEKIKEVLGDDFLLLNHDEVISQKWFGETEENKLFRDGIGDFLAIGIGNKSIRYDERGHEFASTHAGITEDEVYVPLVMVKK